MDVRLPDGTVINNVPEGTTKAQLAEKLRANGFAVPGEPPGMLERGNIDLSARPVVKNQDGSISTVRSLGVNIDGEEVLIPTVSDVGRIMSDDEAIDAYRRYGKHLGKFSSPEAATSFAEQLHKDQENLYSQRPTNTRVAINAASKVLPSTIDALLNTPTNVLNLAKAGIGTAAIASGRSDLAPSLTPTPDYAMNLYRRLGLVSEEAEPQTPMQRVIDRSVQGALGGAISPSSSAGGALRLAMTGGAASGLGQAITEGTGSEAAGTTATMLAPLAIAGARAAGQGRLAEARLRQAQNAPRDKAMAEGLAAGYKLPPSTINPSLKNVAIESIAGKAATTQDASLRNVEVTNNLARKSLGLPQDAPLTREATQQVRRDAYQTGYAPIEQAGSIGTGRIYRQELNDIVSKYTGAARSFPQASKDEVRKLVDSLRVRSFDAGDAIKQIQILRDDASKALASGDTAMWKANRAAAEALENQIERGLPKTPQNASLLQNFRDARQMMAKAHTVEEAIDPGTGNVNANKLASDLKKGRPLSGELKTIGEFATNFRKAVQPPQNIGSPGVSKIAGSMAALMGGGGALGLGPVGTGLGLIPLVAPPAARRMLLSDRYQQGLAPDYSGGLLGRAAGMPEMPLGSVLPPLLFTQEQLRN